MKKPEKKKEGKKKAAGANSGNKLATKQLQRDFDKRMKVLVRDIKKETQATIKNALKEAKRKLNEGSEFVMNDVLNSIVNTVDTAEKAVTGTKEPKVGKKIKEVLHVEEERENEEPTPAPQAKSDERKAAPRTATSGTKKAAASRARIVELTSSGTGSSDLTSGAATKSSQE